MQYCIVNYIISELETLAIIQAVKKIVVYLLGTKFKIIKDYLPLKTTMDNKELITKAVKWALLLKEADYEVVHNKTKYG